MVSYKFLLPDRSKSAQFITDSFYDVNEDKTLKLFYVTELREVAPEVIQAGINIEVGMYNEGDFKAMAMKTGLILEKWADNALISILSPTAVALEFSAPVGDTATTGTEITYTWTAIDGAAGYQLFVTPEGTVVDFQKPSAEGTEPSMKVMNDVPAENSFSYFVLVFMEDGSVQKSQILSLKSVAAA